MLRTVTLASLLTLSIGGPARAQESGPRQIGSGDDARIVYRPIRPSDSLIARRGLRPGG
ncbi:MAG TPA: hypothetical protein VE684_17655 [Crenalkalicoccus sp.]|nr:hypothetical protein [Crenalkalicoccus sp.]